MHIMRTTTAASTTPPITDTTIITVFDPLPDSDFEVSRFESGFVVVTGGDGGDGGS